MTGFHFVAQASLGFTEILTLPNVGSTLYLPQELFLNGCETDPSFLGKLRTIVLNCRCGWEGIIFKKPRGTASLLGALCWELLNCAQLNPACPSETLVDSDCTVKHVLLLIAVCVSLTVYQLFCLVSMLTCLQFIMC